MKRKGLLFIALFVVSTFLVSALPNANKSNEVSLTLQYNPPNTVEMGELFVGIDNRILRNSQVFAHGDDIPFMFWYDVAYTAWLGAAAHLDGDACNYWLLQDYGLKPEDLGLDDNVTRFSGTINVWLDDIDLGMSNMDIYDGSTYQDIPIDLEIGWHYLTVIAGEHRANSTDLSGKDDMIWDWVKDEIRFYVGETSKSVLPPDVFSDSTLTINPEMIESEELMNYFNWTFRDIRPAAEPKLFKDLQQSVEDGTDATLDVVYNTTWNDMELELFWGFYASFVGVDTMGYGDINMWANDGSLAKTLSYDATEDKFILEYTGNEFELMVGRNYAYFVVSGYRANDLGQAYGGYFPGVQMASVVAIIDVVAEETPEETGSAFGIFISVSMLGLATALIIKRLRK